MALTTLKMTPLRTPEDWQEFIRKLQIAAAKLRSNLIESTGGDDEAGMYILHETHPHLFPRKGQMGIMETLKLLDGNKSLTRVNIDNLCYQVLREEILVLDYQRNTSMEIPTHEELWADWMLMDKQATQLKPHVHDQPVQFSYDHVLVGGRIRVQLIGQKKTVEGIVEGSYHSQFTLITDSGEKITFYAKNVRRTMMIETWLHSLRGILPGTKVHVYGPDEQNVIGIVASTTNDDLVLQDGQVIKPWIEQPYKSVTQVIPNDERLWVEPDLI